ncbi:NADH-ubiquinone/plastoquinone oxidoreductase chain 6 [Gemmatirosa kalamazoonensis]|uniref:NADH-quinone oxidoreductase subunit J n=1 Tax=Gemmatirosa kalamazoonensis TaxID=861299 RepID=W0RN12_9BACT|nr:NADH-quinone oxidoreductase subunit J [Gemmatirosa kalamazoonensis]AHG90823.1 NADH-ubiquinone/plastoquinone oxidoreductase chain 6 [Gemmatirosa kalamazoonensis]
MHALSLFYQVNFDLFGLIAVASALLFVTRKSPVAAALWLVNAMFSLAAMYVMLDAQFVGAVQVLVYAGAIMVVFLFVVMLLNLGHAEGLGDFRGKWGRLAGLALGIVLAVQLVALTRGRIPQVAPETEPTRQVIAPLAQVLFTDQLLAFEVTSILLLAAVVGAVVLARRTEVGE